jgi:hypothetical protein
MLEKIVHSDNLVEYAKIPGKIGTILEKMGLNVTAISGTKLFGLEDELKKYRQKLSCSDAQFFYASVDDKVDYFGFWHHNRPQPHLSTLYLLGEDPDNRQTAFNFVTYIYYIQSLGDTIKRLENSSQLNDFGIGFALEDFLESHDTPFIPEGPAVQIYDQVKKVYDGVTQHTNQEGVLAQLKDIYKEFSGIDYSKVV